MKSIVVALRKSPAPILILLGLPLLTAHAAMPARNVSPVVVTKRDLGPADSEKEMKVLVELRMNDTDAFEKKLAGLFDPESPDYHHWLSKEELDAFAPLPESAATVRLELESHGLTVSPVGQDAFLATGTTQQIARAFNTEFRMFDFQGEARRFHVKDAHMSAAADGLVEAVAGLDRDRVETR